MNAPLVSPSFPDGAQCDRGEADVRAARPISAFDVIRAGANAAVAADPRPLQSPTAEAIDAAVANMPPFPRSMPTPDMRGGGYLDDPCNSPKPRFGSKPDTCQCGYLLAEHRRGA